MPLRYCKRISISVLLGLLALLPCRAEEPVLFNVITGDKVRLREAASLEAKVLGSLSKGELISAVGLNEKEWMKVNTKAGVTGWVHGDYVSDWLIADEPAPGAQFADMDGEKPEEWALVGQFAAGLPVALVGKDKVYAAVTDAETKTRNECAGSWLHEVKLKEVKAGKGAAAVVGVVGKAQVASVATVSIDDKAQLKAKAVELAGKQVQKDKERPPLGGEVVSGFVAKAGEVGLTVLLSEQPDEKVERQYRMKDMTLVCGEHALVVGVGCLREPACFTVDGMLYFAVTYGGCESDDYQFAVYRIAPAGIRCVYLSFAFGC